jgi:hypothetical protein
MMENGLNPELLFGRQIRPGAAGGELHKRRHQQVLDLGTEQQMVLELRPAHDPNETYGSGCVVTSLKDLSSSIWVRHHAGSNGASARKVRRHTALKRRSGGGNFSGSPGSAGISMALRRSRLRGKWNRWRQSKPTPLLVRLRLELRIGSWIPLTLHDAGILA